ncbi:phosphoglycerate kinase [Candidatus Kaiserbacteria bacterium GWA2_50_9]|uniref:Phosphoglycerate kinase n=1 Tax=Candidatus Kaiserbacteria bacterium GWA2_50_9 TaxID=1798474 RepID=A0A1F6BTL7_9BACT|nr:MAG: phosphoglycerate kinase [Candidatus Kaiserbacteria bacterium GWA2_50_9]
MRSVRDIRLFENIPILVRAPLNVPIKNGKVVSEYRLRRALPTIQYLRERGAKIILASHRGQMGTETLAPVASALGELIPDVSFCPETIGERARAAVRGLSPGHILVLENLRRDKGEERNDPVFARELAALADIFVQDSFDTCHRTHASIVGIPKLLPSYAGLLFEEEITELSQALTPKHPSLAVISGVKFSTKEEVLTALLMHYDHVFVGGALANDFLKAAGQEVGKSLISHGDETAIRKLLENPKLVLPLDSIAARIAGTGYTQGEVRRHTFRVSSASRISPIGQVLPNEIILDHGPGTVALLADLAQKAKSILWNGPLGKYEDGFTAATNAFARAVTASKAHSVVGGGDTIATIENLGLLPKFSFVSTGGGAMLDFLARGTLPGIEALDPHWRA